MILRDIHVYWYVIPLVIAVSLVYSATRHESWRRIFGHAFRLCGMIFGVLLLATAFLLLVNSQI